MYEKLHRTKSGRDCLYINHLSHLKFLALFIECLRWFFSCAYPDLSLDAILSCWSFKSCICLFSQILHLRKNNQVSTTTTEPSKSEFETYKKTGGDSEMRIETFQHTQWNLGLIYRVNSVYKRNWREFNGQSHRAFPDQKQGFLAMSARRGQEIPRNISQYCEVVAEVLEQQSLLKPIPGVFKFWNYGC